MRRLLVALIVMAFLLVPAQAQATFTQGAYDFELASVSLTGAWTSPTILGAQSMNTSVVGATMTFYAVGNTLLINRLMRSTASQTMQVCVGALCTTISNTSSGATTAAWQVAVVELPGATDTIVITNTGGQTTLDWFMILDDPSSAFPTPVPTATILPSSTPAPTATPASTTTPQPTPTPQPTSTPAPTTTPAALVWALDPSRRYQTINGQLVSFSYDSNAGDVHIANLLTMLVVSVWGFFFVYLFVLVRYKTRGTK